MSGDYLMRQIDEMVRFLSQVLLRHQPENLVQVFTEDGGFSQGGFLQYRLRGLLLEGRVNEAENLLFETVQADPADEYLPVALDFYEELNKMSDSQLAGCDFSRQEIREGLEQIKRC